MLRPFVPSQDHELSKQFYEAIGFETQYADGSIAVMSNGNDSFILQNFYIKDWRKISFYSSLLQTRMPGGTNMIPNVSLSSSERDRRHHPLCNPGA
jgi:hypothetical protein